MKVSFKSLFYGLFLTWYTTSPVWADDTEIYFAGTSNLIVRPNILFILDTSGSMDNRPSGVSSGPDKMEQLKSAMTSIISNVEDVNVGLMRFSIPGGPILYPVKNIDEDISAFEAIDGVSQSSISSSEDDGEQRLDGTVILDRNNILLTKTSTNTYEPVTIQTTVTNNSDDAYEITSSNDQGFVRETRTSIWLTRRTSWDHMAGVRFSSVDVPKDAPIYAASIDFTVRSQRSGSPQIDIWGQKSTNPATFNNSFYNLTSRTKTTAKVDWDIPSSYNPGAGSTLTAPYTAAGTPPTTDLTPIVEELTTQSGWSSGNPMVFLFGKDSGNTSNYREVYSREGGDAPNLNITYGQLLPPTENTVVALRFNNVRVPQGADITSATVTTKASGSSTAGGFFVYRAETADDSSALAVTSNNLGLRSQTTNAATTSTLGAWADGEEYVSPDLSDVIEEVTNRSGWCGGNSLTFFVTGVGAEKLIRSYDQSTEDAPVLDITYDTGSVAANACFNHEHTVSITDEDDDVEENSNNVRYDSSQLQLGGNDYTGLRFNDVRLIPNANVTNAYLEFAVADNDISLPANLTIKLENSSNAAEYEYSTRPSTRGTVSGSVTWPISSGWTSTGATYRSPDISGLLESVVGLPGWAAGNSISVTITGTGQVEAGSFDGSTLAPKIVINASQEQFDIPSTKVRDELLEQIAALTPSGNTPVVDTYYEAALYYKGRDVDYGLTRGYSSSSPDNRYSRVSHPSSYTGGSVVRNVSCTDDNLNSTACRTEYISNTPSAASYITPITEACHKNYIVLLTDGYANENESISKIETMIGDDLNNNSFSCQNISNSEECGHELAAFLADNDQSGLSGTQVVRTHTVGFDINDSWLQGISQNGDGTHYEVDSADELTNAFDQIIKAIKAANSSFTQPTITVNDLNRLSHREDIYYSLFKPQENEKWLGNLKKYRLDGASSVIVDALDAAAVDPDTGFFSVSGQSFWSSEPDGNSVEKGGAAENIPSIVSRKVYTYTGSYPTPITNDGLHVLTHASNKVDEANAVITKALLGIESKSNTYRRQLLDWARGEDANGNHRFEMGDPLHSVPVLMTYDVDEVNETFDSTIFVATNEGYLHAIDADDGQEVFSFIPQELLPNLDKFYINAETTSSRTYGLDGELTIISNDENNDGDFLDTNDHVWLYAGMRRGGRNYYSLDVSDRAAPELKWVIKGGSGGTTGFEELGYTWSKAKEITVNFDGTDKTLLLFAGGYDPSQDTKTTRSGDAMGRAIYMVDAETGALFWSAGGTNSYSLALSDMIYSIPSDVTVLDMDRDGNIDQFYVGDMGGQVWRFDVNNGVDDVANLVTGGVIADLSTSGSTQNNRRFYYEPDISLEVSGANQVMALGIGSGWRAHPLDEVVVDRYYLIKQFNNLFSAPSSYTKLTEASLYDATDNLIAEGDADQQAEAELALASGSGRTKEGWYITLNRPGEKVLAKSLTVNGQIIFTTYEPEPPDTISCQAVQGTARAYIVSILTAEPISDLSGDGNLNKGDREIQLDQGAIPATPKIIDPATGAPVILIGPEILNEADVGKQIFKTYWRENSE